MTSLLTGVDALVRLLAVRHELDRRDGLTTATMVSGYPGSPLGAFDLALDNAGDVLEGHRVLHRPGLNEELAAAIVWGSQMGSVIEYDGVDGVAGVWYGKAPGLDRSGDAIKHGNAMGSGPNGGVVLFCGDDPSAKSSTLPCDSQYTFEDACVPVLYPGDQQEVIDLGVHAFRLSRYSGAWVGLKVVTAVADGLGSVDLSPERHTLLHPGDVVVDGVSWRHVPLHTIGPHQIPEQESLIVHHRLQAARAYVRANGLNRVSGAAPGARLGIVCAGKTYYDVVQALGEGGVPDDDVRILKLAMTYPLVEEEVVEFEEKRPFVETHLRSILHEAGVPVPVVGKRDRQGQTLVSQVGELDAASVGVVFERLLQPNRRRNLGENAEISSPVRTRLSLPVLELPGRPPGFCSGCPHNRSTVAPVGALVGGGVGCHGIMYFEARQRDTKRLPPTPMGAEGVPWIGLAPFVAEPHLIQNIGDGTLMHSGSLAIRAAVAAGADVTFKVLYNAAVAMTGGQDVTGLMDVPALTRALDAEGVRRIVVCAEEPGRYGRKARWASGVQVLGRDHLPEVQEQLRDEPGVTVIVFDQRCAAENRRLRKRGLLETPPRRVVINEAVCEGCGDCSVKSNCLSVLPVDTEFGEKREIHEPSCNRDYTCLEGDCPSFVTLTPSRWRRRATTAAVADLRRTPPSLPEPAPAAFERTFSIYFTGIGGTGVVTANRVLAAAAEAAGLVVGGMDQTGLSQKAGAVVSHLRLARSRDDLGAAAVGAGGADVYLSGDILQAATGRHLDRIDTGRTVAVVDTAFSPTSAMLQHGIDPPSMPDLQEAIGDRAGRDRTVFLDTNRIAEAVFANPLLANIVLLGAAFQRGALPFRLEQVEGALRDDDNRAAFAWGRWAAHDPEAVEGALAGADRPGSIHDPTPGAEAVAADLIEGRAVPDELRELLTRRTAQVVDYQSERLAGRFLGLIEEVAKRDDAAHDWALTRAVAESWFKLLTYKDEYEVARLHLKADVEPGFKVTYHLHPPVLRKLGLKRKLPMAGPYAAAFRVLRRMKRLRGTPFDVFGWDRDRRLERAIIGEYADLVRDMADRPYDEQVQLAESALAIKGYGPIKEAAVERWRETIAVSSGV